MVKDYNGGSLPDGRLPRYPPPQGRRKLLFEVNGVGRCILRPAQVRQQNAVGNLFAVPLRTSGRLPVRSKTIQQQICSSMIFSKILKAKIK